MKNKEHDFEKGYACAVANLISLHGEDTEAEDTFKQCYMSIKKMKSLGIDERDIEILRPMIKEIERRRKLQKK